jgi:hypothetical protein
MEEKHDFELSADELECLQRLAAGDDMLASLLRLQGHAHSLPVVISLSRSEAEVLREQLTTYLASVGFDENYAPNELGQMLENLIDRFYVCE